jgi:hypothetical protein
LKALARDLPDRYQSAAELGEDLRQFMSQYRFQPTEMQEFVRSLFRSDYSKETVEVEACHRASLDHTDEDAIPVDSGAIQLDSSQPLQTPDPMPSPSLPSGSQPSPSSRPKSNDQLRRVPRADEPTGPQKNAKPSSGGLWSRLRDRFTK